MAKIAAAVEEALARRAAAGGPGRPEARVLARGEGWCAADVVCSSGPRDSAFEEQHAHQSIAIVAAGTFQYRSRLGSDLMTPGSLMLGHAGQPFECAHDHGAGDRCIAFWYAPDYFERLAADAGSRGRNADLRVQRVPPVPALSPLLARACAGITGRSDVPWEELALQLAAGTIQLLANRTPQSVPAPPGAMARVARIVRAMERQPDARMDVPSLARTAGLSPYHFLRTFERVTGTTPHQYLLRTRLREAARRIASGRERIIDVAIDCGFGDVSNFNRTFRAEFGVTPRQFRMA